MDMQAIINFLSNDPKGIIDIEDHETGVEYVIPVPKLDYIFCDGD